MVSDSSPADASAAEPSAEPPSIAEQSTADRAVTELHRSDWGRLLSLLIARSRRLDLAEDALAEAFARASERWVVDGVPTNPAAWVYTTAYRHLVGRLRAEAVAGRKAPLLAVGQGHRPNVGRDGAVERIDDKLDRLPDERLQLILLCCHPALSPAAQSALALRLVVGTSTEDIAALFLVSTPTMAARITRAKKKIVQAGIPLTLPTAETLDRRLDEVVRTIYLAFTAGYVPRSGSSPVRAELSGEAVTLALILRALVPDADQVTALLALLLFQHARRDARVDQGRLVTLPDQDRSRWHRDEIDVAMAFVVALPRSTGYTEELRLQALIAAQHCRARSADDTDWPTVVGLYNALLNLTRSPVVALNRAVAVAEVDGPDAGLKALVPLDAVLADNHRLHAVRADLARRSGDVETARSALKRALELCQNEAERAFLRDRLDQL